MEPVGKKAIDVTASAQHLTTSSRSSKAAMELALYHSKLILGCYRTDDVSDPQVYVTAVAAVLSRYPADVGVRLSDPKEGMAGKLNQRCIARAERREALCFVKLQCLSLGRSIRPRSKPCQCLRIEDPTGERQLYHSE